MLLPALVTAATLWLATPTQTPTPTPVAAALLAAHNGERAAIGVPPLRWNPALAAGAAAWARHLADSDRFMHSDAVDDTGENLWAGTALAYSPDAMVGLWLAERRHYRPGVFPAVSRTGRLEDVLHYTQVIWRDTREVGCGLAERRGTEVLVCRYGQGGNVFGERPA